MVEAINTAKMDREEFTEALGVFFEGSLNRDGSLEFKDSTIAQWKKLEEFILAHENLPALLNEYSLFCESHTNNFRDIRVVPAGQSIRSMSKLNSGTHLFSRPVVDPWGTVDCNGLHVKVDFVHQYVLNMSNNGYDRDGMEDGYLSVEII